MPSTLLIEEPQDTFIANLTLLTSDKDASAAEDLAPSMDVVELLRLHPHIQH